MSAVQPYLSTENQEYLIVSGTSADASLPPVPKVDIPWWEAAKVSRAASEVTQQEAAAIEAMLSVDAAITSDEVSGRMIEKMGRGERGAMTLQELSSAALAELMQEARNLAPWWMARRAARNRDADKIKARRVQAGAKEAVAAAKKAVDQDRIDYGPVLTRTAAQWESWLEAMRDERVLAKTPVPEPVVTPVEVEVWKEMKDAGWPKCACPSNCSASRCAPEYMAAPVKVMVWRAQAEAVKRAAAKRRPNYQRSPYGYPVSRAALPIRHFGLLLVISELYYRIHYWNQAELMRWRQKLRALPIEQALERDWLVREWHERVLVIRQDVWEMTTFYAACYGGRMEPPIQVGRKPHSRNRKPSEKTAKIIELLKAGKSKGAVARELDVSLGTVKQAARREAGGCRRLPKVQGRVRFLDGFIRAGDGRQHFGLMV